MYGDVAWTGESGRKCFSEGFPVGHIDHFEATFGGFQEDLVSSDWAETPTVKQRCFLPQLLGD